MIGPSAVPRPFNGRARSRGRAEVEDVRPFAKGWRWPSNLCRIEVGRVPGSGRVTARPVTLCRHWRQCLVNCNQGASLAVIDLTIFQCRGLGILVGTRAEKHASPRDADISGKQFVSCRDAVIANGIVVAAGTSSKCAEILKMAAPDYDRRLELTRFGRPQIDPFSRLRQRGQSSGGGERNPERFEIGGDAGG